MLIRPAPATGRTPPAITRLSALASLDDEALAELEFAILQAERFEARREIISEGRPIASAKLLVSGWAARVRILPDGRRQFLSFLLPGDLVGMCEQPGPLAVSTVVALTDCVVCVAPAPRHSRSLAHAYATSRALDEAYLLAQITRLGRLNSQERIADLLLELFERLQLASLTDRNGFDMPLTQETIADFLGLTSVHINRMLQAMRREEEFVWRAGHLQLLDPAALARRIGRVPVRVSSEMPARRVGLDESVGRQVAPPPAW